MLIGVICVALVAAGVYAVIHVGSGTVQAGPPKQPPALTGGAAQSGDTGGVAVQSGGTGPARPTATGDATDGTTIGALEPSTTESGRGGRPSTSVAPGSDGPASGGSDVGAGVRITGTGLPSGMTARSISGTISHPSSALIMSGSIYELSPSGPLGTTATLGVPTGAAPVDGAEPVLFTSEDGATWTPLATSYDPATHRAYASVTHFSMFGLLWLSTKKLLGSIGDIISSLMSNPAGPKQNADCSTLNTQSGYKVAVSGNALSVCMGTSNGKTVLRILNTRRYPLIIHPGTATTTYRASITGAATRALLHNGSFSLDSGETADLVLSGPTGVTTEFDGIANLLNDLWAAAQGLLMVVALAVAGVIGSVSATVAAVATILGVGFLAVGCLNQLRNNIPDGGALLRECFGNQETLKNIVGKTSAFLISLMLYAMGFMSTLWARVQAVGDLWKSKDQSTAKVTAASATPVAPVLTDAGFGPVHLGMTLTQARTAAGSDLVSSDTTTNQDCATLTYRTSLRSGMRRPVAFGRSREHRSPGA